MMEEMENAENPIGGSESESRYRRRVMGVVVLLMLTLAGGVAARMAGHGSPAATSGTGPLEFTAPKTGPVHFSGRLDRTSVLSGGDGLVNMELRLAADAPADRAATGVATDLVVVLDRSGSMAGQPIAHARAAIATLLEQLADGDRFALVSYSSGAEIEVPLTAAAPASRSGWRRQLMRIEVGGGTNMAAGLDAAIRMVEDQRLSGRATRVVLLSDGHANEGDHSFEGLISRARSAVRGEYALSAVGVGEGFDERLMSSLADAGTGNFYYVRHPEGLAKVFAGEFSAARQSVARALEVRVELAPGIELMSAAGYPLERNGRVVSFRPGDLFAGQERRIWLGLRVDDGPRSEGIELGEFELGYRMADGGRLQRLRFAQAPAVARVVAEEQFLAELDEGAWADQVTDEQLGALKQAVASALQRGDGEAARARLEHFETRQEPMNAKLKSEKVRQALGEVSAMKEELGRALEAKDDASINRMRKRYVDEGYAARRKGARNVED